MVPLIATRNGTNVWIAPNPPNKIHSRNKNVEGLFIKSIFEPNRSKYEPTKKVAAIPHNIIGIVTFILFLGTTNTCSCSSMGYLVLGLVFTHNAANHQRQKAERSGALRRPSEFALLGSYDFIEPGIMWNIVR